MSLRLSDKLNNSISLPQEGIASFIRKTYELLEDQSHSDIVSWSDDGNFLVIKDLQKFTQRILPVYFKHNKMNSFIRQLNMYNFRKKRTMNSYHVYYNELFKRGKVELLPLIKRKVSDAPSSPAHSDYHSPESYTNSRGASHDLSYENMMLKKINQKAVSKINTLEAKIADLVHENKMLFKKINEKQRKEDLLHTTYSQCYPNSQPTLHPVYSQPVMNSYPTYPNYVKEVPMVQVSTPETDYTSSPDTFLSYENEPMSSGESDFLYNNKEANNFGFYAENTFLGKRSYENENLTWEDDMNLRHEPVKQPCYNLFEEVEDRRINLLDPEFPSFPNTLLDSVF